MRKAGSVKAFSAFFMCPVSHTFPAYNGNEMPSWYTIIFFVYGRVVYKPRCLPLFFLCGLLRQFARGRGMISPQCPGTPRVKPSGKSRLFSDRGAKLFYGHHFSANLFFSVPGFAGLRGRGRGLSLWRYPIMEQERKAASPASASPWRTPANRCRTRLFSAPNSPAFRGSQQPLGAFPLEEPTAIFPHPAARIDKEKGPWYNVHDPVRVALVSCFQAYARAFLMPR